MLVLMANFATLPTLRFTSKCGATRIVWVAILITFGVLSGQVPGLSNNFSKLTLTSVAVAHNRLQITRYVRAVLEIEPLRIQTYERIQAIMGHKVPGNLCHRKSGLPNNVKQECDRYHNESAEIIRNNQLSLWEFNQITWDCQHKPWLKNLIQQEIRRQQQQ